MLSAFLFMGRSMMFAEGRKISPWRAHAEGRRMRERTFGYVHGIRSLRNSIEGMFSTKKLDSFRIFNCPKLI